MNPEAPEPKRVVNWGVFHPEPSQKGFAKHSDVVGASRLGFVAEFGGFMLCRANQAG